MKIRLKINHSQKQNLNNLKI